MTDSSLCLSSLIFRMKTKISTNLAKWMKEFKDAGSEHNAWHMLGFRGEIYLCFQGEHSSLGEEQSTLQYLKSHFYGDKA